MAMSWVMRPWVRWSRSAPKTATETEFFARADMLDTKVGTDEKDSPAFVAQQGFDAMKKGEGQVIAGWKNKVQAAIAHIAPSDMTAEMHAKMAAPGTAKKGKSAA